MRRALINCLLFGLLVACRRPEEPWALAGTGEAAAAIHVKPATVAEQPMPEYLVVTGSLRANAESNIAADASGKVLQMLVERGQTVVRGQVIATLDARSVSLSAT